MRKKFVLKVFRETYLELSSSLDSLLHDLNSCESDLDYAEINFDISDCRIKLYFLESLASKLDIENYL